MKKLKKKFKLLKIEPEKNRLLFELKKIGVDSYAFKMYKKGLSKCIKVYDLSPAQANILKQEAISVGGDAAVSRGTVNCSIEKTDVLLFVNESQLFKLCEKLKVQPFDLSQLANELLNYVDDRNEGKLLKLRDRKISLERPLVMGILNITPDSFSDGGRYLTEKSVMERLFHFKENSVDIVDIGGESTRPGAVPVDEIEEMNRIEFAVRKAVEMGFVVSVDTYKSSVAKKCLNYGVHLINDISGLNFDENLVKVCADYDAALCVMHIKGTPKDMQKDPNYAHLIDEIYDYLSNSVEKALSYGINENSIIVDPGFGFGKTLEDNYLILKYLNEFKSLKLPLLVGLSRKSMIGNVLDKDVNERVLGSKLVELIALLNGADIVRTHDVSEINDVIKIASFYKRVNLNA